MSVTDDTEKFFRDGYIILDLFDNAWLNEATTLIHDRVEDVRRSIKGQPRNVDWTLADYHNTIGADDVVHGRLMEHAVRYINMTEEMVAPLSHKPIPELLEHYWGHREPMITHRGHELEDAGEGVYACGFRVVRPGVHDVTGVHVDTFYAADHEAYDRSLESRVHSGTESTDMITVWIPVVGFDEKYALRIAPGTHSIAHPVEAFKRSPEFITQAVESDYEEKFEYIRPKLHPGQGIVFHPNLLHGGSYNLGDSTRVSMEVRLHNPRVARTGNRGAA